MSLLPEEYKRYNRQLILDGFGEVAQEKLIAARVLIVGAGGLGSPAALYLAAMGVGTIGIIDNDTLDESNLHRQILYTTHNIDQYKAEAAHHKLVALNPYIQIQAHSMLLTRTNALEIINEYDIILDGSDNFATRYLVNDACVLLGKIIVYGSIFKYEGQVTVFNQPLSDGTRSPNYRDMWPTPPLAGEVPNCNDVGVLGVLPGVIGTLMATEAIKIATGIGDTLSGRLLMYDALKVAFNEIKYTHNNKNPLTGDNPTQTTLVDYDTFCGTNRSFDISWNELQLKLKLNIPLQLIDVREPIEHAGYNIGGALLPLGTLLQNTNSIARDKIVVMYCKSGQRSARAVTLLRNDAGFDNVFSLKGGLGY